MNRFRNSVKSSLVTATALFLGSLSGCSGKMRQLSADDARALGTKPIGVVVLQPEKRIEFSEYLFRGLWGEMREDHYSVKGLWDPGPSLGERCAVEIGSRIHAQTTNLWERIPAAEYEQLTLSVESSYSAARRPTGADPTNNLSSWEVEWNSSPPKQYLLGAPPAAYGALRGSANVDQVLEISLAGLSVKRVGPTWIVTVLTYARLLDLHGSRVMWASKGRGSAFRGCVTCKGGVESFKDLEANNLAQLKELYDEAITALLRDGSLFDGLAT